MPGSACRWFSSIGLMGSLLAGSPCGTVARLGGDRRAEHLREPVDVGARAPLGDRDEQPAAVLLAAAERVQVDARVDAVLGAAAPDRGDVGVEAQRELADHGLLVELLDALERRELLARVVRAGEQQLAQLDDPAASEPAAGRRRRRAR